MPRVKFQKSYKKDCRQYADEYPLLAVGVFEAGNSYDMPQDLADHFASKGLLEGTAASEPAPTEHKLEMN
jgi:hypothetical protein